MAGRLEKRRHPRVRVLLPVKYRETLATRPLYKGVQSLNLSKGGLKFQTEEFIPRDTSVILEFALATSTRPIRAISKVTWARELPLGYRYEVGSEFTELIPTERAALDAFMSSAEKGAPSGTSA